MGIQWFPPLIALLDWPYLTVLSFLPPLCLICVCLCAFCQSSCKRRVPAAAAQVPVRAQVEPRHRRGRARKSGESEGNFVRAAPSYSASSQSTRSHSNYLSSSHALFVCCARVCVQEVDVGSELEYHSTFICPVTKEQCTRTAAAQRGAPTIDLPVQQQPSMHALIQHLQQQAHAHAHAQSAGASSPSSSAPASVPSYSNPPVLLKCGHCISQHAVEKIVKNLRLSR